MEKEYNFITYTLSRWWFWVILLVAFFSTRESLARNSYLINTAPSYAVPALAGNIIGILVVSAIAPIIVYFIKTRKEKKN